MSQFVSKSFLCLLSLMLMFWLVGCGPAVTPLTQSLPTVTATLSPTATPSIAPTEPIETPGVGATEPATTPTAEALPPSATPPVEVTEEVGPGGRAVTGMVTIESQEKLAPDAVLVIQLLMPAELGPAWVLDEQVVSTMGVEPIPFTLVPVDSTPSFPGATMRVQAEVRASGKVPWRTEQEVGAGDNPPPMTLTLQPPAVGTLTGTLRIPEGVAVPDNATLTLRLFQGEGISFPDALVNQLVIPSPQPGTIPFTLEYLPHIPEYSDVLTVYADLHAEGRLLLTAPLTAVITQGNPATVELALEKPLETALIHGTVSFTDTTSLPVGGTVTIQLLWHAPNVGDAPSVVVTEVVVPLYTDILPFALEYEPAILAPGGTMYLRAEVKEGIRTLSSGDVQVNAQPEIRIDLPMILH